MTVSPPPNVPPIAAFTSSASYLNAAFNANGSSDPDGSIASYAWDFGDSTTGTGVTPSHTYSDGGTYQVQLTVTDNRGGATSVTHGLTVVANQVPVAAFTPTCTNLGCSFDGSASADADGSIASYAWTFGDGATGTGPTATHTYAVAGTLTVSLTVTDDQGATGAISQSVTVTAPPAQPPSVSYKQNCTYLACTFDGSASAAKDGATITAYAWDFGDGTTGIGVTPSHTYAAPGPYVVTLTVTDSNTKSAFLTNTVTVTALYVADTFTRTIASGGWGTADTGGAWSVSPASTFSVNGGLGRINLAAPGSGPAGFLSTVSKANLNVLFDASVDKVATGGGAMVNLIVRHVGTTDYRYKVRFMADGTVHLVISKVVSSTETTLREVVVPGLTFTRAPRCAHGLQISGNGTTTLTGRVWTAGTTEPATNQITVTDAEPALQAAGSIGIQGYLSSSATNAPVVLSVDNLTVTSG